MAKHVALTGSVLHTPKPTTGSGNPTGVLIPLYSGQLYFDTADRHLWVSTGVTVADWTPVSVGPFVQQEVGAQPSAGPLFGTFSQLMAGLYPYVSAFGISGSLSGTVAQGTVAESVGVNTSMFSLKYDADATPSVTLRTQIPPGFAAWGSNGIRLFNKVSVNPSTPDTRITIEVMDPEDGLPWATPKITTRDVVGAESSFAVQQITKAVLDTAGTYAAGDMLKIVMGFTTTAPEPFRPRTVQSGKLLLDYA